MRSLPELGLIGLLAAGCAQGVGQPPTHDQPVRKPQSAALTPAPPISASASSAAAPASAQSPLPLPPAPPGSDPEHAKIAASICAAAYVDKKVGCRSPPPFVRPDQKPDGVFLRHKGDPSEFCAIRRVYQGSFTRAGARQAVVSFDPCVKAGEMYTAVLPGSAVLIEQVSGRWVEVDYQSDVNTDNCLQARRADAREVLLCRSRVGAPVTGEIDYFFLLDFARKSTGKGAAGTLSILFGDLPTCEQDPQRKLGLTAFEVVEMKLSDVNHDGTDDLVVKVKRSHVPDSPALTTRIRKQCERNQSGIVERAPLLGRGQSETLEFLSEGDRFVPSAATKRLLDTWRKLYPEHLNFLDASAPPPLD